jgi:hypothetical protein
MTDSGSVAGGIGVTLYLILALAVGVLVIIGWWLMFTKAGKPGWAAIIPIYNVYTLLKVVGRPGWWLILYIIPIVNVVIQIVVNLDLARSFGRGGGFALGLIFLPFIFYPILGFGPDRYLGPAAA